MSDIEDKLMVRKEAEQKREKQLKAHEERLREINYSLRGKNIRVIGIPEEAERKKTTKYIEQITAANCLLSNLFHAMFIYYSLRHFYLMK